MEPRCSEHYKTGRSLSNAGQYEAALVSYQSAYARVPVPLLLINIGRMQHKLRRMQPAIETYRRFLREANPQTDQELRPTADTYLRQAEAELAAEHTVATPPTPEKPPIYKKWWFWTAIGGGAVAVGLGLGLSSRTAPGLPPDVNLYEPMF